MSRTTKGAKRPGFEYQGKRPFNNVTPSKKNKKLTHKMERARANAKRHMELSKVLDENGDR